MRADRRALEQMLMNLLSNAIIQPPRRRSAVAIEPVDGHLRIAVRDEGAGLTPSSRRGCSSTSSALGVETSGVPGTGLGLVITRELAQAMGAALQVRSTPGSGSTFSIALPAARRPRPAR